MCLLSSHCVTAVSLSFVMSGLFLANHRPSLNPSFFVVKFVTVHSKNTDPSVLSTDWQLLHNSCLHACLCRRSYIPSSALSTIPGAQSHLDLHQILQQCQTTSTSHHSPAGIQAWKCKSSSPCAIAIQPWQLWLWLAEFQKCLGWIFPTKLSAKPYLMRRSVVHKPDLVSLRSYIDHRATNTT